MQRRGSLTFLAAGLALVAVYFAVGDATLQGWLYQAVGPLAAVAVVVGVRRQRPAQQAPWYLLALGLSLWSAGDAVWFWYEVTQGEVPAASIADVLYLAAYPVITAAAMMMVRARRPGRDVEGLIDGLIIGVSGAAVAWLGLIDPLLGQSGTSLLEELVIVAYPVADVAVLAVLARLVLTPGGASMAWRWLAGGLAATLAADVAYLVQVHQGTFVAHSWVDAGWLLGYVLFGVAALDPTMATLTSPGRREGAELGRFRLVMLGVALLSASLVPSIADPDSIDRGLLGAGSAVLVILVVWRMAVVMAAKDEQLAERRRAESALRERALADPLTGLGNRDSFVELVSAALGRQAAVGGDVSVLFLDLDHFKVVNDTLGHQVGDEVLKVVASRLRSAVEPGILARFGGDEFTVVCEHSIDPLDLAQRLSRVASEPVRVGDRELRLGASVGIATARAGTGDAHALLRDADTAMYRAKAKGRGECVVFDDSLRAQAIRRFDLESKLHLAPARGELELAFQPEFVLGTGAVFGVEALLRWEHPELGRLSPGDFIEVAESTGLIVPIGEWVLEHACQQALEWQPTEPGAPPIPVAVNLSSRQLARPGLAGEVAGALERTGLPADLLFVEITESALLHDPAATRATLSALKDLGVSVAVDDFGTGYFSLSQLKHFPIDILKIDRQFVAGLACDPADRAIVAATIDLAHGLGMVAVAEGVESPDQVAELRRLGCDVVQGYLYARPVPSSELRTLLPSAPPAGAAADLVVAGERRT